MASFKYRATADGTLSDPYRFIEKGQIVVLDKEVRASWLKPIIKGKDTPEPEKPLMPYMKVPGKPAVPLPASGAAYDRQIERVLELERMEGEGGVGATVAESKAEGTGNQDVL